MNIKRDNPLCFAIYEEDSECMSCRMVGNFNGYECTALKNNEGYISRRVTTVIRSYNRRAEKDSVRLCRFQNLYFRQDISL